MIRRYAVSVVIDEGAIDLDFSASATVKDLLDALGSTANYPQRPSAIGPCSVGAWWPEGAAIEACQIRHGSRLQTTEVPPAENRAPILSPNDEYRVVHEDGPQIGLSWPVSSAGTSIVVDWLTLLTREGDLARHSLRCLVGDDADTASLTVGAGHSLEVGGSRVAKTSPATLGTLLRITRGQTSLLLRVLSVNEHELLLRGTTVPYRVTSRPVPPPPPDVTRVRLTSPPPRELGSFNWSEAFINDLPAITMGALFGATRLAEPGFGNKLIGSAFFMLPFSRMLVKRYQLGNRQDAVAKVFADWKQEIDHEIGAVRDVALQEAERLGSSFPDNEKMLEWATNARAGLWQRRPADHDFLQVSLGRGTYLTECEADFAEPLTSAKVEDARAALAEARGVADVPRVLSLANSHIALLGSRDQQLEYLRCLLPQIVLHHSPNDLGIALCLEVSAKMDQYYGWLRWLPHLRSSSHLLEGERIAFGYVNARALLSRILESSAPPNASSHALLVVHESSGAPLAALRTAVDIHEGRLHVIWLGSSASRVPEFVKTHLSIDGDGFHSLNTRPDDPPVTMAAADSDSVVRAFESLSQFHDDGATNVSAGIPQNVGLSSTLELAVETKIETQIFDRWRTGLAIDSLRARLGVGAAGLFCPDLVKAGPHLLIGGTTGSGKSELLRSMIVSLAIDYSPRELAILLIDFKGGAGLKDLESLPHAIGCATNLESADVQRLIEFLSAEINRRQAILREYQGDYSKYRRAGGQLPRLVVVIDEFGGFTSDGGRETEGRNAAMINIAARGRSLGMHLVLATQQPKRSVNSQISANVNLRLCLRTLDEDDSVAVIDSKLSAHIPRSLAGRCFARMSSSELIEFQSTRSDSTDIVDSKTRPNVELVAPTYRTLLPHRDSREATPDGSSGSSNKPIPVDDTQMLLDALLTSMFGSEWRNSEAHIVTDEASPYERTNQPILHRSLSEQTVTTPGLSKKITGPRSVALGLADEPARQEQEPRFVDLDKGAVLLEGGSLSGKTSTLLALAKIFRDQNLESVVAVIDMSRSDTDSRTAWASLANHIVPTSEPSEARFLIDQLAHLLVSQPARATLGHFDPPILLCIDRLDLLVPNLASSAADLVKILTEGPQNGLSLIATRDSRIPLDRQLHALFNTVLSVQPGATPGRFNDSAGISIQAYPAVTVPQTATTRSSYSLGRPTRSAFPDSTVRDWVGGLLLGVEELSHDPFQVFLREGLAIVGPATSGRTATLLTLAKRLWLRTGKPSLVLADPQLVDELGEAALDLAKFFDSSGSLGTLQSDVAAGKHAPVLFVDDFDRRARHMPNENNQASTLEANLFDLIKRSNIRLFGAGGYTSLSGSGLGEGLAYARRNFLVLQPPQDISEGGLAAHYRSYVRPRAGRNYGVGEGIFVGLKQATDVVVVADEQILAVVQNAGRERSTTY